MHRRHFLHSAGLALAAVSTGNWAATGKGVIAPSTPLPATGAAPMPFAAAPALVPIRAAVDRIIAIDGCTRPFRAQGPRIEAERIGRKTVVHNYGHGGSGWSLSWGAAEHALRLVRAADTNVRELAVIGCGAIGLTTAVAAQRAGLRVRIYARERLPDVRSFYATGVWSPDSRVCTSEHASTDFKTRWEEMARISFRRYQTLLGLPGEPIEWRDGYALSDVPFDQPVASAEAHEPDYPPLERTLLHDLGPRSQPVAAGSHPFPVPFVRRYSQLTFNISAYSRLLLQDFLQGGGELYTRSFDNPRQFADLREKIVINATGYGARALLGDDSVIPVRGQTARLIPQPEVTYGLVWRGHNLNVVPRRDGLLVQAQGSNDFNNADSSPDRAASEAAVRTLAQLFAAT
ncbi:D-amino-acid oxidase [Xanthomonas vesicatoria ATCC 35937]|uniref:D-amino-acid oxidase n=1 Tax=Xanthomonas vesicatoria ATCC 35937 TaxID=925775 RepID=F0B7U2_9XANT|nr:FAD-dependent oxidoreductase [Xanthomonas vesicatoria]APP75449.1 D-amino-acid oxidase [Xanthomonas vesicatoria ATCC 35937]EGD11628.1 FAD dependent oxidoreductase [Xanthomonas vesicatoria ATCC 35937]KTF31566.1 D-amino acid oxidase [Xanthomonas vesicatoria]MCC8599060.1 FAD-binding oxidoreductase [Xanthomonas vesicatoria]MCC8603950.1 FAD-binding oxidoreductase [Xanthomonas vesicatoria]